MNAAPPTHVTLSFDGSKRVYTYHNHEADIAVGDYALVELPSGRLAAGKVMSIDPRADQIAASTKWIIQKIQVDRRKYDMLTALEPPPTKKKR